MHSCIHECTKLIHAGEEESLEMFRRHSHPIASHLARPSRKIHVNFHGSSSILVIFRSTRHTWQGIKLDNAFFDDVGTPLELDRKWRPCSGRLAYEKPHVRLIQGRICQLADSSVQHGAGRTPGSRPLFDIPEFCAVFLSPLVRRAKVNRLEISASSARRSMALRSG